MASKVKPIDSYLNQEIRKAMIDADADYSQLGEATARAWRYRIGNPLRMTLGDFFYLCARLHQYPWELISRSFNRR